MKEEDIEALNKVAEELDEATDQSWRECVEAARNAISDQVEDADEPIFADIDELLKAANADNWDAIIREVQGKLKEVLG